MNLYSYYSMTSPNLSSTGDESVKCSFKHISNSNEKENFT